MAWVVDKCCCGCSLKTGSLLIAVLQATLSGTIFMLTMISTGIYFVVKPVFRDKDLQAVETLGALLTMTVIAVPAVLHLVFDVLLAIGAGNEKPKLMRPWVIYSVVLFYFSIILLLFSITGLFLSGNEASEWVSFGIVFTIAVSIALQCYFIIVVKSHIQQLTEPNMKKKNMIQYIQLTSTKP